MDASRLMERVAQGDLAAFEALYNEYARLVYGIALRIVKNEFTAEDVTQSVFMKTLAVPGAFRSGNFAAWISRVARNRALDELRRGSKLADLSTFALPAREDALEDEVIARLSGDRARALLKALPGEQRSMLEAAFFEGLTHSEIAASTGMPLGTIKSRIRAGLAAIRKVMKAKVPS
ncbi:MAG: sigma-70 family RNA polymerase sigma factor [Vulcanimicrobiaceae bacterium]